MDLTKHLGTVVSPANLVTLLRLLLSPVLFAMVLVTMLEPSSRTVALAIGLVSWPTTARLSLSLIHI